MRSIVRDRRFGARASAVAAALAAAACGGASGSVPSPAAPVVVRFVDAGGALAPYEGDVRTLVAATVARVEESLPLAGVTITVGDDAGRAIAGYGLGGFTPDAANVRIDLDPAFPGLTALLPERLPGLCAHELHHAVRWRGPGYGRTLLEALVSEGLADRFAVELLGISPPPWTEAFGEDEVASYLEIARAELDATSYDHARWFFGTDPLLPRWTGYTLGYGLVLAYQQANPGVTAAHLVAAPADLLRPG